MKTELIIDSWNRKEHFNFFKNFEEPFYGFTINIDCDLAYNKCKYEKKSFFLYYLYRILQTANAIPEFKYVIEGDQVFEYETINVSPTIERPNGTFGFGHFKYCEHEENFIKLANNEIKRIQASDSILPPINDPNQIHFSAIPWINFTSLSHARPFSRPDSSPKISVGKMVKNSQNKLSFPLSIHVHHALMDGKHVAQFIDHFQSLMLK